VIVVIGANPTDGHPVFASRMKRRLRQGAQADRRSTRARIDLVRSPHIEADYHLPLRPGTNVARASTRMAHVVVTEGLVDEAFVRRALRAAGLRRTGAHFVALPEQQPGSVAARHRRAGGGAARPRPACTPPAATARSTTAWASPSTARARTMVHGHRQPGDGHRQHRPRRRRREPAARPEQRAGCLRHGLVPARVARATATCRTTTTRALFEQAWGVQLDAEPGLRIPNMLDAALDGSFKGLYIQGEDIAPVRPEHATRHRRRSRRWSASSCRTCS
jgi:formate dehydrogenase major subunit